MTKKWLLAALILGSTSMAQAFTIGTQNLYHYTTQLTLREAHMKAEFDETGAPDIAGFQEAARWIHREFLFDYFVGLTGYHGLYQKTARFGVMNDGVALVSKFGMVGGESKMLPATCLSPQAFNSALLQTPEGLIRVLNVHLSPHSSGDQTRINQAKFILDYIRTQVHEPVIVMGDFNDGYNSATLKQFFDFGFKDVLPSTIATYNPDTNPLVTDHRFGPTRLDYILYLPSQMDLRSARLTHTANWISDHYGVTAELHLL